MEYHLYIGNRLYFSWSIAAYLMFERFGLADQVTTTVLRPEAESGVRALMAEHNLAPARTLPTLVTADGAVLNDSFAIAEELATRHPEAGLWPTGSVARGTARALAAEMHAGFHGLRGNWPVNLRQAYAAITPPDEIASELDRLEDLWTYARRVTQSQTPWLCGPYSLVDAIFAPMALRLAGYGFHTRPTTKAYVEAHLADPALRRWRALGLALEPTVPTFEIDASPVPWRGPTPRPARAVQTGPAENATCPYSGKPVSQYLQMDGRTFGFCNAGCRDKTLYDPEAWPDFMKLT